MSTDGKAEHYRPRPIHLHWRYIGLVGLGGAFGTAARYLLETTIPVWAGLPLTTLGVNVIGAFALGLLLEALLRRGHDEGYRRALRLLIGTGFLGGFTTYSSLAIDTDRLAINGAGWTALAYAATTLILGVLASYFGIVVAARHHRSRHPGTYGGPERTDAT